MEDSFIIPLSYLMFMEWQRPFVVAESSHFPQNKVNILATYIGLNGSCIYSITIGDIKESSKL